MELSKQNIVLMFKRFFPALLGAAGGYAYFYWVGCVSGTCPITNNPLMSTGYGALLGLILTPGLSIFVQKRKKG